MIEGYTEEQRRRDAELLEATVARAARNLPPEHPDYDPFYDDDDETLAEKVHEAIERDSR